MLASLWPSECRPGSTVSHNPELGSAFAFQQRASSSPSDELEERQRRLRRRVHSVVIAAFEDVTKRRVDSPTLRWLVVVGCPTGGQHISPSVEEQLFADLRMPTIFGQPTPSAARRQPPIGHLITGNGPEHRRCHTSGGPKVALHLADIMQQRCGHHRPRCIRQRCGHVSSHLDRVPLVWVRHPTKQCLLSG